MRFSGGLFYQGLAVGPRLCIAAGICPTKALPWSPGSVLQWVVVLLRTCGGAEEIHCIGCLSFQGLAVGPMPCI